MLLQVSKVLRAAVLNGDVSVVQLLLDAGAHSGRQDCTGGTPLLLAMLWGHWDCAEALVLSPGGAAAVQVTAYLMMLETMFPVIYFMLPMSSIVCFSILVVY